MDDRLDFLVLYDYGTGGLWAFLRALSANDITDAYPELEIVAEPPQWMSQDLLAEVERLDIEASPAGLLLAVLADR